MLERLNKEFRRRSKSIGVFPNVQSCLRLFTLYTIKYADSWEESRHKSPIRRRVLNKSIYTIGVVPS
ncbi:MAG: transposase [Proteobacteria bacterium]|nr:transposase [Pseudomonadota bacterium]